jgi:RNA polymerase sigma-70 factor (ECF subfamily)
MEPFQPAPDAIRYERGEVRRAEAVVHMTRELVRRAIEGDHDAFSSLVDASIDRLHGLATLILRDPDRAQDAVQEALMSAWKDVRALRDPDAWDAWLHRITVWACYRAAKKERRRVAVELRVVPDPARSTTPDAGIVLADRDLIERQLNDLPIDHRAVIVLRFYLDLPLEEVGDILGIPVGTVKSRLHRALASLRESMTQRQLDVSPVGALKDGTA